MEESLCESIQQKNSVNPTALEGMIFQLAGGVICACNTTAERILGYTSEQMQGYTSINFPWQTIHEDGSPWTGETHPAMVALKTAKPCNNVVMGFYKPSGELVWLLLNSQPLFQANAIAPYGVVTTFTEIPGEKQSQSVSNYSIQIDKSSWIKNKITQAQSKYSFIDYTATGGCVLDSNLVVLFWNNCLEEWTKIDRESILGTPITSHFPHLNEKKYSDRLKETFDYGLPIIFSAQLHKCFIPSPLASGECRIQHTTVTAVPAIDGVGYNALLWVEDITNITNLVEKYKHSRGLCIAAELGLYRSNSILNSIIESSPNIVAVKDLQGRYAIANKNAASWLGMTVEKMLGCTDAELFSPEAAKEIMEIDSKVITTGTPIIYEGFFPREGITHILETTKFPWRDEQGNIIGVIAICRDITARKQLELTLEQSQETIRRQLGEIEAIYTSAPVGLCFVDTDLRFVRINSHLAQINGVPVDEHIGRTIRDIIPEMADRLEPLYRQVIESGEAIINLEVSGTNRAFPGVKRDWLVSYYPLKQKDGKVLGVNVVVMEISDRKRIEKEKEQLLLREQVARSQAEKANRVKDEFLAILSHELRTPLNPILGWAKLLKSGKVKAEKTVEGLNIIERNAKLQINLIEDLLDVSRLLRGKLALNISKVNLASIISQAIETVSLAAKTKAIAIQTEFEPHLGEVTGDQARLQQVVWNLLSNAIKFTPSKGQVKVKLETFGSMAQIVISDTGKGIKPDFLPYIFEYFHQEDASITRKFGGLGLGLAIVRNLVELHGGTISAESPGEGKGSTFTVKLPLLDRESEISSPTPHSPLPTPPISLNGIKVLVVDDEPDSRSFASFALELYGANVTTVSSAFEALQIFEEFKPDVLVSDIGMSQMDGYELLRRIRSKTADRGGKIPAIALTAYAGEFDQQQAIAAGFQIHLPKPVDPDTLAASVARAKALRR